MGVYGVAWGTSIAMAFVHLYFWPRYVRDILDVPIRRFVWEGWFKITLCAFPYAAVCAITDRYWHAGNLVIFFAQIAAVLPVYAICVLAVFRSDARRLFIKWQESRLVRA
jgi:hypothetical protein